MKKIALSLVVMAASGAYVWSQSGQAARDDLFEVPIPGTDAPTGAAKQKPITFATAKPILSARPNPASAGNPARSHPKGDAGALVAAAETRAPVPGRGSPATVSATSAAMESMPPTPEIVGTVPVTAALPRLRPHFDSTRHEGRVIPASTTAGTPKTAYTDGTYVGPVVDAYYGLIQIEATIQGGQLVSIRVLKYPSDRRTSVFINHQALPMLRDEVVSAQSADVDIITGATLTSEAFIRSLGGALKKARL